MQQPVDKLRSFFTAFFAVEQPVWSGLLSGWPGLPNNEYHETWSARLGFALNFFLKMPWDVRLTIMLYATVSTIQNGPWTLIRSLTPGFIFGAGPEDPHWEPPSVTLGDESAKEEARRMMKEFVPTAFSGVHHPPVSADTAAAVAAAVKETSTSTSTTNGDTATVTAVKSTIIIPNLVEAKVSAFPAPFN
jgi:lycopene beta-cyclase